VFTVLVYWGFERALNQYVDSRLVDLARTLGKLIDDQPNLLQTSQQEISNFDLGKTSKEIQRTLREASHFILVLSPDGTLIWRGSAVIDRPLITEVLLSKVQEGQAVYDTVHSLNEPPVRRVSVPVQNKKILTIYSKLKPLFDSHMKH